MSDSGYILKVDMVDFPNTVALIYQTKKGIQRDSKNFGSTQWQDGVETGKAVGGTAGGEVRSAGGTG